MRTAVAAVALAVAVTITGCTGQHTTEASPVAHVTSAASLRFDGVTATLPAATADEGVASVDGHLMFRGYNAVLKQLPNLEHVGDPDSRNGYVLDAYQGKPGATVKTFRWTAPDGTHVNWVHPLVSGEMLNNSFVAISPDGRWFVSGEWGPMRRLLVFPLPGAQTISLAGTISLDAPLVNAQGCDFAATTLLICTSDGPVPELVGVDLSHPLNGQPVTGTLRLLAQIPTVGKCFAGPFEPEGVDVTGNVVTVMVNPPGPCHATTLEYRYSLA